MSFFSTFIIQTEFVLEFEDNNFSLAVDLVEVSNSILLIYMLHQDDNLFFV